MQSHALLGTRTFLEVSLDHRIITTRIYVKGTNAVIQA